MNQMPLTWLLLFSIIFTSSQSSKILVVLPLDAWSHYMQYEYLFETLAQKGHEVTIYSPYKPKINDANLIHRYMNNNVVSTVLAQYDVFEEAKNPSGFYYTSYETYFLSVMIAEYALDTPEFINLLNSNENYDLIMMENIFCQDIYLLLHYKFNCPLIQLATTGFKRIILESMNNPNIISFTPELYSYSTNKMNFIERIFNLYYYTSGTIQTYFTGYSIDKLIKNKLGLGYPSVSTLLRNTSLIFLYSSPALEFSIPVTPNIIQVGGIHIQKKINDTLPEDLKTMLDNASEGFIIFAFGSFVSPLGNHEDVFKHFIQTFGKLKQKVFWKWNKEPFKNLPGNVLQMKWLPQLQMLGHPNCKLFITHGGQSSFLEAIHNGIPTVTIPFFGDQFKNGAKSVEFGNGLYIKFPNISTESLSWAINTILQNPSFKEKALERSKLYHDRNISPVDKAIYWVEYVIKHKGAQHLIPSSKYLNWFQYFLLDVIAFLIGFLIAMVVILKWLIKLIFTKRETYKILKNKKE